MTTRHGGDLVHDAAKASGRHWLTEDAAGLGEVWIVAQDLSAPRDGNPDILAAVSETQRSTTLSDGLACAGQGCRETGQVAHGFRGPTESPQVRLRR